MSTEPHRICPSCGNEFSGTCNPVRSACFARVLLAGLSPASLLLPRTRPSQAWKQAVQRFEHYEVVMDQDGKLIELGRGAMGITYKALDVNLRCPVTLKVISDKYVGDESARLRFLREARAAAKVRHANVASVFHLWEEERRVLLCHGVCRGGDAGKADQRSGRLEVNLALEIVSQVAAGLEAIHEQKLVHRDIKPTNIMVRLKDDGRVTAKIIDLGLAKGVSEPGAESAIEPWGPCRTPEFASPEQFAGVQVDIRSDLYSLAVTLWEMLTGRVPFRGTPGEVMHQHQHVLLPLEHLEAVPQPVVVLLDVLLEKDPVRRFQNPAELLPVIRLVKGATKSGRPLMKTLRVFISSTGDVQKERHLAERVMRSIAAEFNLPVSTSCSIFQRLAEEKWCVEK